jgi:hypothetical protein
LGEEMVKKIKLNQVQKERVSDCIDSLKLLAIPEKWKIISGYTEQVRKSLVNVVKGLQGVGITPIDVMKSIECINYGRKDLAYKYLFESSNIKDPLTPQLDARFGVGSGPGALNELFFMLTSK